MTTACASLVLVKGVFNSFYWFRFSVCPLNMQNKRKVGHLCDVQYTHSPPTSLIKFYLEIAHSPIPISELTPHQNDLKLFSFSWFPLTVSPQLRKGNNGKVKDGCCETKWVTRIKHQIGWERSSSPTFLFIQKMLKTLFRHRR